MVATTKNSKFAESYLAFIEDGDDGDGDEPWQDTLVV